MPQNRRRPAVPSRIRALMVEGILAEVIWNQTPFLAPVCCRRADPSHSRPRIALSVEPEWTETSEPGYRPTPGER